LGGKAVQKTISGDTSLKKKSMGLNHNTVEIKRGRSKRGWGLVGVGVDSQIVE